MNEATYRTLQGLRDVLTHLLSETERGQLEAEIAQAKRWYSDTGDRRDSQGLDHAEAEITRLEQQLKELP